MRIVLDTNTIVSGVISAGGPPRRLMDAAKAGAFELVTSETLLAELLDVLGRKKIREHPTTTAARWCESDSYAGLGNFDKGIALIQKGIAKGGMKRTDDANLHLGIALMRAGQKGRAAQAFKAVTGGGRGGGSGAAVDAGGVAANRMLDRGRQSVVGGGA